MTSLLDAALEHLRELISFDTRNPPRAIGTDGIFDYLRAQLSGFNVTVTDHGAGAVSLLATRGNPTRLFNVHLDTVPDGLGNNNCWAQNPFELQITNDKAIGLGACDIKGAAASLLAAANATEGSAALLFTTDEEADDARCISTFLKSKPAYDAVIVAEPTDCRAVLAHRGISSVQMQFTGRAGHASDAALLNHSALHQAVQWSARALAVARDMAGEKHGGLSGMPFNIGRIEGGVKANVIAASAALRFGFRPLPFASVDALLNTFRRCADPVPEVFEETFRGAPLPGSQAQHAAAHEHARMLGLPVGEAVNFWTEAALFSEAGYPALVYGPGNIAQAHSAGEWVALEQLAEYSNNIYRIIENG